MTNLDLIDWRLAAFSALWLTGLAVLLAVFSFDDYLAAQQHLRTRALLSWPGSQAALHTGFLLFCLRLLGLTHPWWQQLLWALLAAAFAYQAWSAWRRRARPQL